MPRVKLNRPDRMTVLIHGYWQSNRAFAEVLGCSANTAGKKIRNPQTLTIADLKAMQRHGVPIEEIRNSI